MKNCNLFILSNKDKVQKIFWGILCAGLGTYWNIFLFFFRWFSEEKSLVQKNKVKVVTVYDGDSLDVMGKNGERIKLRLYGIDAPEKGQHFANTARAFLEDLTENSLYTLDVHYKDKYNRYVAVLYDENGIAVQEDLIRNGFAWVYPRFCDDVILCVGWQSVQDEAKNSRQGLWQEENPITPWDYKHHKK